MNTISASSGVLQKFKKTFSNFKNGKTTIPVGDDQSDAKHHRYVHKKAILMNSY